MQRLAALTRVSARGFNIRLVRRARVFAAKEEELRAKLLSWFSGTSWTMVQTYIVGGWHSILTDSRSLKKAKRNGKMGWRRRLEAKKTYIREKQQAKPGHHLDDQILNNPICSLGRLDTTDVGHRRASRVFYIDAVLFFSLRFPLTSSLDTLTFSSYISFRVFISTQMFYSICDQEDVCTMTQNCKQAIQFDFSQSFKVVALSFINSSSQSSR